MAERIPPHNDEAERSVLGAAMLRTDALLDVMEEVRPQDFYNEMHREIFTVIRDLSENNTPIDVLTVSEELKRRNALEMVGGRAYIASLSSNVPSTANARQYAKIVAEKAVLRSLIKVSADISEESFKEKMEAEQVLDFAERGIFEIAQGKQHKDVTRLKEVLDINIQMIDEASRQDGHTGLTTGFRDLDDKTSGLQRSDLIIVAARPGMGKTAFALNVALQAALKGKASVLIFSLEMSKEQLGQRLLAMEARVDMQKLKTGNLSHKDWEDISLAIDALSGANIFIDDTAGISMMEIRNKCRRTKMKQGLDLVVLDYLQLMSDEGRAESRQLEISALSRKLKLLAREMECPVLVLSQLSRAPEQRQDHQPQLSDLRESGSIEQDADIVLFLYRDDYYKGKESEKPGVCDVMIAKQRSGPTGKIELTWLEKYTRFVDKSNMEI